MLLAWMAYSALFGGVVYAAALAADRAAATWNRGQRAVWILAVIFAAAAPAVIALRPHTPDTTVASATSSSAADGAVDVTLRADGRAIPARSTLVGEAKRVVTTAEGYVVPLWLGASIAWLALFLRGAIRLHRQRARWRAAELDGVRVLVAPNVGPAVIGLLAPSVVIPEWALSLDDSARALMLQHEAEHIRARDPLLLVGGALMTALFPWNPALWALVRRLRLAIEIDCDRRVLGASARQREYGLLLLTVGARQSVSLPLATSLAERRPFLERRIRAMTTTTSRHPRLVSAACVALALVATTAAVRAPHPASLVVRHVATPQPAPTPVAALAVPAADVVPSTPSVKQPQTTPKIPASVARATVAPPRIATLERVNRGPDSLTLDDIRSFIQAHHPSALAGDPDINSVTLVVDADNRYVLSLAEFRPPLALGRGGGRGGRGGQAGAAYDADAASRKLGETRAEFTKLKLAEARGLSAPVQDSESVRRMAEIKAALDNLKGQLEARSVKEAMADSVRVMEKMSIDYNTPAAAAERKMTLEQAMGLNGEALGKLIDMDTIDSVRLRTFSAGELGTTALRVYIVKQKP